MDLNAATDTAVKFFNSGFGFAVVWAAMAGLFMWLASRSPAGWTSLWAAIAYPLTTSKRQAVSTPPLSLPG